MRRRTFLQSLAGSAVIAAAPVRAWAGTDHGPAWTALRAQFGDRLQPVASPLTACADAGGAGAEALFARLKNPYHLGDEPGLTQTMGWIDAWTTRPSAMVVAAESAADVAAAVQVAARHGLRIVVKGGGHSYFGNSNAADSLLVWTRPMDKVEVHDAFRGEGWPDDAPAVPAVSVGAGALWGRVYKAVAVKAGRYVQGGGCLTVGVAGFVQGGGFGSLSKAFGTGAANLLEAEIVTADGKVRIVNARRDPELFFALRGGGGGTFGIVTRVTLKTHDLPSAMGAMLFGVTARSDRAWRDLVAEIIRFYAANLFGPVWGEQIGFRPGRRLSIAMVCHGLEKPEIEAAWAPFMAWLRRRPEDYSLDGEPLSLAVPARRFWDPNFLRTLPGIVLADDRPGAPADNIFWATNLGEAAQTINAYRSAWLPATLLQPGGQRGLVDAIIEASAHWSIGLHTNKGLAGGTPAAIAASGDTATNPDMLTAFALLICAADAPPAWPGIPGHEPDIAAGRAEAARVAAAMAPIDRLVPGAGSYMSEADYFDPDWKRQYWGANYARLAAAKRTYDPGQVFRGHHAVEPA